MITVADIMTSSLYTLSPQDTLAQAATLMAEKRIRHIPILEKEKLVGLISERDLLAAKQSTVIKDTGEHSLWSTIALHKVMTKNLTTVDPKASVKAAALYIQQHKFGCLPVVKRNKLIGIITDTDFVAVAINLLELEELHEHEEI
ncbi:CBS domain-containing protein [Motilimonas eburnea]|uniref:CBS domain-containing protein n=1 Tax=Motilimonas eburnea TaxID=1737488 RepID=UPI001E506DF0|nr:CBS domain-containing protein [Motilimonas eburnea]MCE2570823.1 CBS domain-containing protein [Motilimonas eburnea]